MNTKLCILFNGKFGEKKWVRTIYPVQPRSLDQTERRPCKVVTKQRIRRHDGKHLGRPDTADG